MSFFDHVLKFIAARVHIPPDVLDYVSASAHVGHSAETLLPFPAELIQVGARLVARGWLNNKFFPSHRDWILPYWAECQFDPENPAFLPRGMNLYTLNYTHRDWTMLGNLQSKAEAIVDPRGLVTPWFDGWSVDVWLEVEGKLYVPSKLADDQVEQALFENLPLVVTSWRAKDLALRTEICAVEEDQGGEWVMEEVRVSNLSSSPRHGVLYVSIRPFNPEGVSLVKRLVYKAIDEAKGAFLVNEALGLLLPKPDRVACSDIENGDVALAVAAGDRRPEAPGAAKQVQDESGLATGVAAYDVELGAGESRTLFFRMPMKKVERDEDDPDLFSGVLSLASPPAARARMVSGWRDKLAAGMRIRVPDEQLQSAFDANKAFLLLLHDGDTITPGPFTYHQFWLRDAAYMLNALDKLGYHAEVRQVLNGIPRRMEKDGFVRATEGEWDSNGEAIWAMVENARLSGDKDFVAQNYWSLLRMASWINSKRQNTKRQPKALHSGLLPSGPSAEHLGPSDYYYWDDFWGLAGLDGAVLVAGWLGQSKDADKLRANRESFQRDVDASLAMAASRLGRTAMPASPYRCLDAGMMGNLAALYPLRLVTPDDPRIVDTIMALKEKAWKEDAYLNDVGHSALGTYLSLHVAECYLFQKSPEAWPIIRWQLANASPTFTWAEGINPVTRHGGMGDGHHGWAAADFLLAVRNLLLFEEHDHLVLTPALQPDWTAENSVIKVENAATYFGDVSFTIAFGERTGTLVINADWRQEPEYVEWNLPFVPVQAGTEDGEVEIMGKSVHLGRGVKRVVVMW